MDGFPVGGAMTVTLPADTILIVKPSSIMEDTIEAIPLAWEVGDASTAVTDAKPELVSWLITNVTSYSVVAVSSKSRSLFRPVLGVQTA